MPGFNQTGPMGQGSMTGRRMGRCTNFGAANNDVVTPEKESSGNNVSENFPGRGFGFGRGLGLGRGQGGRGMGRQNRFRGGF